MKKAIAFIPELRFNRSISRRIKLTSNLYLLSNKHHLSTILTDKINNLGYNISNGSYLYFEGNLNEDGTLYEIFQGYCLALMFFYFEGKASCRAIYEVDSSGDVQLFIDEYDKFGVEEEDVLTFNVRDVKLIEPLYSRVESQLQNKKFNSLRNSLDFYVLYLKETIIKTRLLYLSICLESLLIEGSEEGISYKLGIRCANLINKFHRHLKMDEIFKEVKNGYNLRSTIIHGSDYSKISSKILKNKGENTTELDHVYSLEKVVRIVLSIIFSDQRLYEAGRTGKLGAMIDDNYILNKKN